MGLNCASWRGRPFEGATREEPTSPLLVRITPPGWVIVCPTIFKIAPPPHAYRFRTLFLGGHLGVFWSSRPGFMCGRPARTTIDLLSPMSVEGWIKYPTPKICVYLRDLGFLRMGRLPRSSASKKRPGRSRVFGVVVRDRRSIHSAHSTHSAHSVHAAAGHAAVLLLFGDLAHKRLGCEEQTRD